MNSVIMWIFAVSALLGGLDKIFGNRFGLGERFDEGFRLIGPLISGMLGILSLTPVISAGLQQTAVPLLARIGMDPAVLGGLIPIDMGGYQLAVGMAKDPLAGLFAGVIMTSTFGCTLCFTIPVGFGMMKEENRSGFVRGILCGLIVLPLTLLTGGMVSGLGFRQTLSRSLPLTLLGLLLALGMWKWTDGMVRLFTVLAKVIQTISIIGILTGFTEYLTGFSLIPGMVPLPEALRDTALCGILLIGCIPFAEILSRLLHRPLHALGARVGLLDRGLTGMLLNLVSATAVLGLMHDMDRDDVTVNAAFLVSATCVLGPHLSVCMANAPEMVTALIISKLTGGMLAALVTVLVMLKDRRSGSKA